VAELLDRFLPSPLVGAELVALGLLWALVVACLAGHLKLRRDVATNYTRKIFHFCIFTAAMAIHVRWGFPGVNAFSVGVVLLIGYGLLRGKGNAVYESMARERDAPHRTFYIAVPLATTALGGLVSNLIVGDFALVGYLVTGWGDAIGEPVGRWLGRHPYRVTTLRKVPCTRTVEGSVAVGVASFLAAMLSLTLGFDISISSALWRAAVIAPVIVLVEAVSPHGSDNFTTMLVAAVLAAALI
jgi:phytol kinase